MQYRLLGPLDIVRSGSAVPLGGPRHRRLLAALLVSAGEVVSADRLVDILWGEQPPATAAAMLHVRVSELRKSLRDDERAPGIVTYGSGYALSLDGDELDAERFQALAEAGRHALRQGDPQSARDRLREALSLWRGRPFGEMADEPFVEAEVARLDELHLQALEDHCESDLSLGAAGAAAAELRKLVAEHPLRERLWCLLMLAEYRSGRQAEALGTYAKVRDVLVDRLGVDPGPQLQALQASILRQDADLDGPAAPKSGRGTPGNLPLRLNSFIGRETELATVYSSLNRARLVTVLGAGGVGKSSLALEAAAQTTAGYPDGLWLVELSLLGSAGLVAHSIADTLGVREQAERPLLDVLVEQLRDSRMLLILDNCEHVVDEAAEVAAQLLRFCGSLSILTTSRERLGVAGELTCGLTGLGVPVSAADVATADASQLLLERAAAVRPGLTLDEAAAAAVVSICRRLDGLPLAIELAAARVSALELPQIADRLDDRFRLLTGGQRTALPRHRTLRAVIDWSYALLDAGEARLFEAAAVFAGGFTLEGAEAVCKGVAGPTESVADVLARLVDRSLVVSDTTPDGRRYRLLETLREYGLERLREHGAEDSLRERHAAYFLHLVEPAVLGLRGDEQPIWLRRLELEYGNVRAALGWSLEWGRVETAARLTVSLYPFWDLHGRYSEGRGLIKQVLAFAAGLPAALRAQVLMGEGTLAFIQGDLEAADNASQEAAALSRQAGDPAGVAHALQFLAFGALFTGENGVAEALLDECLSNARLAGDRWLEAWGLLTDAALSLSRGDYDRAVKVAAEGEAVLGPQGDPECRGWLSIISGSGLWRRGDTLDAIGPLREALEAFVKLKGLWGLSIALLMAASVASARDSVRSVTLLAASERLRLSVGAALLPFLGGWLDAASQQAQTALGADAFTQAWAEGEALPVEAAAGLAARTLAEAAREPSDPPF